MKMATTSKNKKYFEPEIAEICINPEILQMNPPSVPSKKNNSMINRTYRPIHKKFNSVNTQKSKFKEKRHLNTNQDSGSQTMTHTTIETPKIATKYTNRIDKLNTSIKSLRKDYKNLIHANFFIEDEINNFKKKFFELKRKEEEKKKQKLKQEFLYIKQKKIKQEQEKRQKLKEEIKENKQKEIIKKKEKVQKLKCKEINSLINHRNNLIKTQLNKKRIKEEEKQFIEHKINEQKNKNLIEKEKRRNLIERKEYSKAEREQGNEVYQLEQTEKDLKSKIKIVKNIKYKLNKQYSKYVCKQCDDKCIREIN
jgi:chromosome segregation ATPase